MNIALVLIGLAMGAALGWLAARSRSAGLAAERDLLRERLTVADTTAGDRQDLAVTVAPLREALTKVESHLRELEGARLSAYVSLTEQVGFVRQASEALGAQTTSLVNALRAPQARGRWGEMQLRRVVEMAGMVEHCDFVEQATAVTDEGSIRPDLVVRLGGGKQVVVDAKVSLAAYLEAAESRDPDVVEARMRAHAGHLRDHVVGLAAKEYWRAFDPTPEFVVLFVPGDAFLAPALERDPALLDDAMGRRVLIATPTTLMAMLRTIAYSWQQEALTAHARSVFELGRELYRRLGTLGGHVDKLGKTLGRAVDDYNKTVGSLERTVLVQARKMAELQVTDADLAAPTPVEATPRPLGAPELLADLEREADDLPSVEEMVTSLQPPVSAPLRRAQ
ncbi:MAG: recombination protein RmuC [Actinomycetota bacterium]|jgi:DNA recombination protein RmuC|nr:recombination protein RmuC [Actinomycetota bacterium]